MGGGIGILSPRFVSFDTSTVLRSCPAGAGGLRTDPFAYRPSGAIPGMEALQMSGGGTMCMHPIALHAMMMRAPAQHAAAAAAFMWDPRLGLPMSRLGGMGRPSRYEDLDLLRMLRRYPPRDWLYDDYEGDDWLDEEYDGGDELLRELEQARRERRSRRFERQGYGNGRGGGCGRGGPRSDRRLF